MSAYNKYILGLKGDEYESLKSAWKDLYSESRSLYKAIESSTPTPNDENSSFNPDDFIKYRDAFSDECSYFF